MRIAISFAHGDRGSTTFAPEKCNHDDGIEREAKRFSAPFLISASPTAQDETSSKEEFDQ